MSKKQKSKKTPQKRAKTVKKTFRKKKPASKSTKPVKKPQNGIKKPPARTKDQKRPVAPSKAKAPIKQKTKAPVLKHPPKRADIESKLKYLYAALYEKKPVTERKPNNYNIFQTCLADHLNSLGREKWEKFGKFKDISRTLWAKYKAYPINRLCQNIDEVFANEFNDYFPTRNADVECIKREYSAAEWFFFRDVLYTELLLSQCIKLRDKIFFIGEPGVISSKDISPDKKQNADDLHEDMKTLFYDRPSPKPRVVLYEIKETSRGRLLVYYRIQSEEFSDASMVPIGSRTDLLKYKDEHIPSIEEIEAADEKEFGPKPTETVQPQAPLAPVPPVQPTTLPPVESSRLAELTEERKIAELKLETEKIQLEREKMLMERIKIAKEMGLTGDQLMAFLNLK